MATCKRVNSWRWVSAFLINYLETIYPETLARALTSAFNSVDDSKVCVFRVLCRKCHSIKISVTLGLSIERLRASCCEFES